MAITLTLKKSGASDRDLSAVAVVSAGAEVRREVENDLCKFVSSDLDIELNNADGWFDTYWLGLLNPEAVYPYQWYLQISKEGTVIWEGDLDPTSVTFDGKRRTVSATFLDKLKRLENTSASSLLRDGFRYLFRQGYSTGESHTVQTITLTDPDLNAATDELVGHYMTNYTKLDNFDLGTSSDQWAIFRVTANTGTTVTGTLVWPRYGDGSTTGWGVNTVYTGQVFWVAPMTPKILSGGDTLVFNTDQTLAAYGLLEGDKIGFCMKDGGVVDEVEVRGLADFVSTQGHLTSFPTDTITPALGTGQTGILLTPYNRNMGVVATAEMLFDAAGITSGNREISIVEYDRELDYLDLSDKTVLQGLTELAAICNGVLFATPSKFYLVDRDTARGGGATKAIDSLILEKQSAGIWQHYSPSVRVDGADSHFYRVRGPSCGGQEVSVSTDFVRRMATLKEIALRLYAYFGAKRQALEVVVADDGTAWQLWDTATIGAVSYWVVMVGEPLQSVDSTFRSSVTLGLVEKTATAPAPTTGTEGGRVDLADLDEPIPPLALEYAAAVPYYTRAGGSPYCYAENNGASYDYPIYFEHDPQDDLWKLFLLKAIASSSSGSTEVSAFGYPFNRSAPSSAPTTGSTPGGAKAERTYYVRITYANARGETERSDASTQVVPANSLLTVTAPTFPGDVGKCHVYYGEDPDALYYQGTISTTGGTHTEGTGAIASSGPLSPTSRRHRAVAFTNASGSLEYSLTAEVLLYTGRSSVQSDAVTSK